MHDQISAVFVICACSRSRSRFSWTFGFALYELLLEIFSFCWPFLHLAPPPVLPTASVCDA